MSVTTTFDVRDHIGEKLGWITLFPGDEADWATKPTYQLIEHLKEVHRMFDLLVQVRSGQAPTSLSPVTQTLKHLAINLTSGKLNNEAQRAVSYCKLVEKYLEQLSGASAARRGQLVGSVSDLD